MKPIEITIWKPIKDKPGYVTNAGNMTVQEIYDEVKAHLKQNGFYDEMDYFGTGGAKDSQSPFPQWHWIACYAVQGGSEGHYIHVDTINSKGRETIFTGKTFHGMEHALKISNELTRLFWRTDSDTYARHAKISTGE